MERRRLAVMTAGISLLVLAGCGGQGSGSAGSAAPEVASLTPEQRQAALASLPAPYNTGDLENGERQFGVCRSCHTIGPEGRNMTGPKLYGVFGRKAGSVPDFNYSDAVKQAGFVWDGEHLDRWLADPRGYLKNTKMTFPGVKDPKDRIDLIAYLKLETGAAQVSKDQTKLQP